MEEWVNLSKKKFSGYIDLFNGLSEEQQNNFTIKKEHSVRVAETALYLADKLNLSESDKRLAFFIGLFHDIGRFKQLVEFNTFDDSNSVDHADYSNHVLTENNCFGLIKEGQEELALLAIVNHNKRELPKSLSKEELVLSQIIRDADKLDILKVLSDYYANPRAIANHTLTWEKPSGGAISKEVAKQVLSGVIVSKDKVENQLDIKVMQLSWVYDINFKQSFELVMKNRFLEKIYNSLPKNDKVIEIYRKVKVYAENKFLAS